MPKRPWIEGGAEEWLVEQERRAAGGTWEKASQNGGRAAEAEGSSEDQGAMQLLMSADFQRKDQVTRSPPPLPPPLAATALDHLHIFSARAVRQGPPQSIQPAGRDQDS
jgi:hypothetical protein